MEGAVNRKTERTPESLYSRQLGDHVQFSAAIAHLWLTLPE